MDFFKHFRTFLGLPDYAEHLKNNENDYDLGEYQDFLDNYGSENNEFPSRYDVFSDPMDMHRYFEHQMNKIFKSFGVFEFGHSDPFNEDSPRNEIEIFQFNEPRTRGNDNVELRDYFLKPGYERASPNSLNKSDKDIDGKNIDINQLDSVVSGKIERVPQNSPKISTHVFGKSISTKTIVNPDGSVETQKTIRDSEGNEETTITKRIADKEHTIIKKRDKSGREEIIENLVNMDEKDTLPGTSTYENNKPWSFFDGFFKN